MSKTLVLAEKPSVARELARVLGCRRNGNGFIEGEKYIVTWALGHLVTLADPEEYSDAYKKWSLETLPMLPEKMKLKVIPETSKQYAAVKGLLLSKEVDNVIIATDAGREGELVARWIIEKAGCKKPLKRLWISSQTDRAIKDGFAHLRDGKDYVPLCNAAKARAEADWLVGLNVTRALTCKNNAQLSAGRVQTPTLAIIAAREEEIRKFKSRDYYSIYANLGKFNALYKSKDGQSAVYDKDAAEKIAASVKGQTFTVKSAVKTDKRKPVPMLYDLTELQRDANKIYKMSPKETLSCMQRLYETHKALTYPRTDSRYITDDIVPTLGERLRAVAFGSFAATVAGISRTKKTINKACVNNAKVSDHHAIIPTEERPDLNAFSNEEKKIYLLVVTRFLACFYGDYQYKSIKAEFECGGETFYVTGMEEVAKGWKSVSAYDVEDDEDDRDVESEESLLPSFNKGDKFKCESTVIKSRKTSPPSRYTEASLLSAMENPSKFITDRKMKEYIGGGLGTPATRADIIEKLYSTFYIEKKDNVIHPTSKGMQLISIVPSDLKEPLLTATWEKQLEEIATNKGTKEAFITDIRKYSANLVKEVANSNAKYVHDNLTRTPCPECGKMMLEVTGKKGKLLVCQDRECGYRQNLSMRTKVRCPNCHKPLELVGSGDKKLYTCTCGFREKPDRFHAEHSGGNSASKKFVNDFLKAQDREVIPKEESPFALAMKKAMESKKNK